MKRGALLLIGVVFLVVLGVVMFIAARSGSNQPAQAPVIKVWSPFDEKKVYDEMVKRFLADYPGTSVEFKYVAATDAKDYEAKVVDAIASGNGPDVWLIRTDWLPKHASKLTAMPQGLGWQVGKKETELDAIKRIFSEAVVAQNSYQGGLYGLPTAVDSLVLFVNKQALNKTLSKHPQKLANDPVLSAYPRTWGELEQWVRLLTIRNGATVSQPTIALGTLNNTYAATDIYTALLSQFKGDFYNTPTEVVFNLALGDGTVPATKALDLFTSFSRPDHPNYTWNESLGDPVKKFVADELPLLIGYAGLYKEFLLLDNAVSSVQVVPLPQAQPIVLPTDERTDFAAYWTHVVPRASSNNRLAWRLITYLVNSNNQDFYASKTLRVAYMNVSRKNTHSLSSSSLGNSPVFPKQVFNARPVLKPDWQFVDSQIQAMIRAVQAGQLTVQAAVDTTAQRLKEGP